MGKQNVFKLVKRNKSQTHSTQIFTQTEIHSPHSHPPSAVGKNLVLLNCWACKSPNRTADLWYFLLEPQCRVSLMLYHVIYFTSEQNTSGLTHVYIYLRRVSNKSARACDCISLQAATSLWSCRREPEEDSDQNEGLVRSKGPFSLVWCRGSGFNFITCCWVPPWGVFSWAVYCGGKRWKRGLHCLNTWAQTETRICLVLTWVPFWVRLSSSWLLVDFILPRRSFAWLLMAVSCQNQVLMRGLLVGGFSVPCTSRTKRTHKPIKLICSICTFNRSRPPSESVSGMCAQKVFGVWLLSLLVTQHETYEKDAVHSLLMGDFSNLLVVNTKSVLKSAKKGAC